MDVLREREVKGSLERQLVDAQKLRGKWCFRTWNLIFRLLFTKVLHTLLFFKQLVKYFHWNYTLRGVRLLILSSSNIYTDEFVEGGQKLIES